MTMPETTQSDLVERLRELDAAATPGPWAYRPDDMDDWGIVKSPRQPVDGFEGGLRCCLAQFRHPEALDEEVLNAHRRAKTDPWQGNAELVTFLRNAVPDILGMAAEITRLRADSERLQKIESQMDGGRFDEWPTATFAGQLRMQSRDNLDPEYSQFMAATANRMGLLSGQYDAQLEIAERAKEDAARLRAHCEALERALGLYTCHPCPVCNGDCGSANPPVLNCPTQAALNAFGGWDAYRKENHNA